MNCGPILLRFPLVLPFVVLGALLLRLWQINESLWLDELHTAWVVENSVAEIAPRARIGNQSPLYFVLVWLTTRLCGFTELGLRLPALMAGVALVPAVFCLVRRWTGDARAGLTAALLLSWDRNFIFYAQEARAYALLQIVALAQLYIFWSLVQSGGKPRRLAFVVVTALLIYLHYTGGLVLCAELAWLVFISRQPSGRRNYGLKSAAADLLAITTLLLPMFPHLVSIAERRASWAVFVHQQTWLEIARWFSLWVCVVLPLAGVVLVRLLWPLTVQFWQTTFSSGIRGRRGTSPGSWTAAWSRAARPARYQFVLPRAAFGSGTLVVCWLVVPLGMAWLVTSLDLARLFYPRYLLVSAAAPIVFAGFCVSAIRPGGAQNTLIALVLATSLYSSGLLQRFAQDQRFLHDRNQDWRAAVQYLESQPVGVKQPVLVRSGFLEADRLPTDSSELLRNYCLAPVNSLYRLSPDRWKLFPLTTTHPGRLGDAAVGAIVAAPRAWFIINGTHRSHQQFDQQLRATLQQRGLFVRPQQRTTFGHVLVVEYEVAAGRK